MSQVTLNDFSEST